MKTSGKLLFSFTILSLLLTLTLRAQEESPQITSLHPGKIETTYFDYIPNTSIGSSILVAEDDKIIYQNTFGLANLELNVPLQKNMVFGIGSITKQFTAVSIMKLVEQKKISLSDKISYYIANYPPGDKITIEHLLRHTSGIKSFEKLPRFKGKNGKFKACTPIEVIEEIKKIPLEFTPGTKWSYSNSGYFILGYIIEQVSGKTFQKHLEEDVFLPLNLRHTVYGSNSDIINRKTSGYKLVNNDFEQANYLSMSLAYSAGAIFSTTTDVYNWYLKLFNGQIIKQETLAMMCQPTKLKSGETCNYGLGFFIDEMYGKKVVGHTGGLNGYSASVLYLPKEKIFVSVFSNVEGYHPGILSKNIMALAMGKPLRKKSQINIESTTLKGYEGNYRHKNGMILAVGENNKELVAKLSGNSFKLKPHAIDSFYIDGLDVAVRFKRNVEKEIIELIQSKTNGSSKTTWKKIDVQASTKPFSIKDELLESYCGIYLLKEKTHITVSTVSGKPYLQVTGQNRFELIPESETVFKVKGVDASIEFKAAQNENIDKLILSQFGKKFECKKLTNES